MFLGLFGPGPNPSACFIKNGNILFWAEEERFSRIKTSPNSYPFKSIKKGLKFLKINADDIKAIGYAWDCINYKKSAIENLQETSNNFPSSSDKINKLSQEKLNLIYDPELIKNKIILFLKNEGVLKIPPIYFLQHHLCHAASTLPLNPQTKHSAIISNDGVGGIISSAIFEYKDSILSKPIKEVNLPNSLGSVYAAITEYLGYRAYEDEGRVMGLSCYGKYDLYLKDCFKQIIKPLSGEDGFYETNPTFRYNYKRTFGNRYSDKLIDLLGPPRKFDESPMEPRFRDIAFALQNSLEDILINMCIWTKEKTNVDSCFFAGGVHMNCKANGAIVRKNIFKNCFFQPASSDNGVSLGAALLAESKFEERLNIKASKLESIYKGTFYSDTEIEKTLKKSKVNYIKSKNISKDAARSISKNKIIAWFQGRMEVGARSLGARSILANPINKDARDQVNVNVKNREKWRPFCPSVLEEHFNKYFLEPKTICNKEYMIVAFEVHQQVLNQIPSCIHIDGTARPQIVSKNTNNLYWNLINHLGEIQDHPIVLNTSFNIKGEPIVENPEQALRCFYSTGIDELFIGSFIVKKN